MDSGALTIGFPPIADLDAQVLILGTLPGEESLKSDEYYANPTNCFWQIVEALGIAQQSLAYPARLAKLIGYKIALWDVLAAAQRTGSRDSGLMPGTELPNNSRAFFKAHRSIKLVCFNGKAPKHFYDRLVNPFLQENTAQIVFEVLPSTSGANTTRRRSEKIAQWKMIGPGYSAELIHPDRNPLPKLHGKRYPIRLTGICWWDDDTHNSAEFKSCILRSRNEFLFEFEYDRVQYWGKLTRGDHALFQGQFTITGGSQGAVANCVLRRDGLLGRGSDLNAERVCERDLSLVGEYAALGSWPRSLHRGFCCIVQRMLTHHFTETDDGSIKGGWWAGHYGEKLCTWIWDAEARTLEVRCAHLGRRVSLAQFSEEWLTNAELRKRLPPLARETAESVRGEPFEE